MLAADRIDLALTYDFNLAPASFDLALDASPLWSADWGLGVPARPGYATGGAVQVFRQFEHASWIVNSRNQGDEQVVATIASMAGFEPRIEHRADSLDLVHDLINAGLGIGLLPLDQPAAAGIQLLPLNDPGVRLRSYTVPRRGRAQWPPLALIMDLLSATARSG